MNDLDFAALLVSRVCHDLVSPVGAVVNGLEVLEDERDAAMRADALKLVAVQRRTGRGPSAILPYRLWGGRLGGGRTRPHRSGPDRRRAGARRQGDG